MNELFDEVYKEVTKNMYKKGFIGDYSLIERGLNEIIPIEDTRVEVKEHPHDPYKLCVTLTLPTFIPVIHEDTGELWYHCTRTKEEDYLMYTIKEDKYIICTNNEDLHNIINIIFEEDIIIGDDVE